MRWLALAFAVVAHGQTPAVSDLRTVSIRVDGVESYNAAFRLLTEDFGLPAIYGKILTPAEGGRRNYAGIWAGNTLLEICGPWKGDFAPGGPAELERRGIPGPKATALCSAPRRWASG